MARKLTLYLTDEDEKIFNAVRIDPMNALTQVGLTKLRDEVKFTRPLNNRDLGMAAAALVILAFKLEEQQ